MSRGLKVADMSVLLGEYIKCGESARRVRKARLSMREVEEFVRCSTPSHTVHADARVRSCEFLKFSP